MRERHAWCEGSGRTNWDAGNVGEHDVSHMGIPSHISIGSGRPSGLDEGLGDSDADADEGDAAFEASNGFIVATSLEWKAISTSCAEPFSRSGVKRSSDANASHTSLILMGETSSKRLLIVVQCRFGEMTKAPLRFVTMTCKSGAQPRIERTWSTRPSSMY